MENLDVTVLHRLHGWRAQRQRALLATVVLTWGSSPRPVGSILPCGGTPELLLEFNPDAASLFALVQALAGGELNVAHAMNPSPQGTSEPSGPTCFSPASTR